MPSAFDEAFELFAAPMLDNHFGVTVVFYRGQMKSSPFVMVWNTHEYEVVDSDGFATVVRSRDGIAKVSDVVVNGQTIDPHQGDRIKEVETGDVYELMPIGKRPAAEVMPGEYRWKMHTKRIRQG